MTADFFENGHRKIVFSLAAGLVTIGGLLLDSALAQAVAPVIPDNLVAAPGETKTNNVTNGVRSTLTVSSSSSFGTSSNLSATNGTAASTSSTLVPLVGVITNQFGDETGRITADVQNTRSVSPDGGTTTAGGTASSLGITSSTSIELDPTQTTSQADVSVAADVVNAGGMSTGNAGSSIQSQNSLNIDLSNTSFSNVFSQAF
jgi:hypothetical protein